MCRNFLNVLLHYVFSGCVGSGIMLARGALIKPWVFKEIKEQRHWDITSTERLDMLRNFTNFGMEHWGSDDEVCVCVSVCGVFSFLFSFSVCVCVCACVYV